MNIGVFFGGRSSEHDISVLTGVLTVNSLKRHEAFPIYIGKDGKWRYSKRFTSVNALDKKYKEVCLHPSDKGLFTVKGKRIANLDAVIICCHGAYGEDGALAGLLEHSGIPYAPGGVLAGAVGMDKVTQKRALKACGVPVLDFISIDRLDWQKENGCKAAEELGFPVIVKPSSAGSSIGISVAKDGEAFVTAVESAFRYDDRVIVEKDLTEYREFNAAVLGINDLTVSQVEEPISKKEFLDYYEKYSYSAGAERIFPAKIDDALKTEIQETAKKVFRILKCYGVARADFLYDGKLYFNEINTVPGSMSAYLFDYDGISFEDLSQALIESALIAAEQDGKLVRVFDNPLLSDTRAMK